MIDPKDAKKKTQQIKQEVSKIVVGQEPVVHSLIRAIISGGHVLMEGLPGTAKTATLRTVAETMNCGTNRVQFTVDLLPTDITGISTYNKEKGFYVIKGPVFANFVLADEINRALPKTQSALLEAMQEGQVTIGKRTHALPRPFFVMATINPIESAGTYPLPEAQLDRFLFKILLNYPTPAHEEIIIDQNITTKHFDDYKIKKVISPSMIIKLQEAAKNTKITTKVKKYITKIVDATRFPEDHKIKLGYYIEYGASPRATIGIATAARAEALMQGRSQVTPQDVKEVAKEVLRHRIILTYEGLAQKIATDEIIDEILKKIRVP